MLESQNQNYMARRGKGHVVSGRLFTFLEFISFPLIVFVLVFFFFFFFLRIMLYPNARRGSYLLLTSQKHADGGHAG
ncbi:Piso0_004324 [Millerozyma farinosa CBS 7064]|uniref:Piso0_004324 protein n=1 Tax=Pichia sorbitophila (strain ATCC MYA-4447 / BCRC 22081 / CBS 7064 / NBRC 10061 / NRRL Y-12695) TaxID=559304 RepID=G8Y839_PICSO|nr:Piso0_004324 [Millerozyma farinosa CBS 7064]CCE84769.1 Piso0_004324 [Millerozyma farinosa CBS 7064]